MTLENLLKIGLLHEHSASARDIARLLASAERSLADAGISEMSVQSRFDAAYKSILQVALIAMFASGYRPATSKPGHHRVLIQALPRTLGLEGATVDVLDALRRKRNAADYEGREVTEPELSECLAQAGLLLQVVRGWLQEKRPDLLRAPEERC